MTEEKRKNDTRTVAQILSDEMDRQFEEDPPKLPTLEEFRVMAYERLEQEGLLDTAEKEDLLENDGAKNLGHEAVPTAASKRGSKKLLRRVGMAAGFIVAVLIGAFAISMFTEDVGADKNPKETIVTEDGVIIEDGGYGSSEEEDNVWVTEDWEHVKDAKELFNSLLIPKAVPKGFEFVSLQIKTLSTGDVIYEYVFSNNDNLMEVEGYVSDQATNTVDISNIDRKIQCNKGKVYIKEDIKTMATIVLHDGTILSVWGDITDEEIINVVEGLE